MATFSPTLIHPALIVYTANRSLDPVFALVIGFAAAGIRIRREEKEKGRSGDVGEVGQTFVRRLGKTGFGWGDES